MTGFSRGRSEMKRYRRQADLLLDGDESLRQFYRPERWKQFNFHCGFCGI